MKKKIQPIVEILLGKFGEQDLKKKVYLICELRKLKVTKIELQGYSKRNGMTFNPDMNCSEFEEIYFGDLSDEDQGDAHIHWEEITCIGNGKAWIPIKNIESITYY